MKIPVISPTAIKPLCINSLMKIGFCYVKLPPEVSFHLAASMKVAGDFFKQAKAEKDKFAVDEERVKRFGVYHGYARRIQQNNSYPIEQFILDQDYPPIGPFSRHTQSIHAIDSILMANIFKPVVSSIYSTLKLPESCLNESITNNNRSMVFQHLPKVEASGDTVRFNAHKDFGIATIVSATEPGLEVKHEEKWWPIAPKKDYAVLNLGNAIEKMTDGLCRSAWHRVTNVPGRISTVFFISPDMDRPVNNHIRGEEIARSGKQFFQDQFAQLY